MNLFRRKSVTELQQEAQTDHSLKRALGALNLTMLGIGAIIGTGIIVPCSLAAARGVVAPQCTTPAVFNLPAVIIIAIVTTLLVIGIKESANVNNVIVFIKVAVVLLFIVAAVRAVNPANWHPFIPPNTGDRGAFGWTGVMAGVGLVFFAYIGFDA